MHKQNDQQKKSKLSKETRNNLTAYAFCTPWFIGFVCFTLFPIGFMLYNSMTNRKLNGISNFIGLANYRNMFKSASFLNSFKVTIFLQL